MTYIKHKVVMLPTNEKAKVGNIVTRPSDNRMAIVNVLTKDDPQPCIHQHLYILSDEKIKEGDWFIANQLPHKCLAVVEGNYPFKVENIITNEIEYHSKHWKKIIATTDKFLGIKKDENTTVTNQIVREAMRLVSKDVQAPKCVRDGLVKSNLLPQPPQSFIEKYVEEYNKVNVITEVMVEYEKGYCCSNGHYVNYKQTCSYPQCHQYCDIRKLKINPDNTINIQLINEKGKHILQFVDDFIKEFPNENLEYLKLRAENWIKNLEY